MACNGMLAGLVAITAPCAFVSPNAAVIIGIIAGIIVCFGVLFNERVLKVDDPCGAISVHGYCGWFGAVSVGIFADGTLRRRMERRWRGDVPGAGGQGVTGLLYGDTQSVSLPTHGRNAVRGLRLWRDLCRLRRRQCGQVDAREPESPNARGSTCPSSGCRVTPRTRCQLSHRDECPRRPKGVVHEGGRSCRVRTSSFS